MKPETRVVIMDRHALVRIGLRQHFAQLHGLAVTAEFADPGELLQHLQQHAVDVVVIDCFQNEHAMAAEALLAAIRERSNCRIVIFTMESSSSAAALCIQAGADACVDKRQQVATLAATTRSVVEMEAPRCACQDGGFFGSRLRLLSRPEIDVMRLVARGMGTVQISNTLGKARSTVSTHKWNALGKLRVGSELEFLKLLPAGFQWPQND